MNILVISPTTSIIRQKKGDQVRIGGLVSQLIKRGHNVTVLEVADSTDKEKAPNFRREVFKKCTPPFLADLNVLFYRKIYRILSRQNIDLIQISFPTGIIATKIVTKLLRVNVPIVYDSHNVEGVKAKQYIDRTLPLHKRLLTPFIIPLQERLSSNLVDMIICTSKVDKESFIKKYNIEPEKIEVIPTGTQLIDLKKLKERIEVRKELNIKDEEIVVVFHGTYSYYPNKEAIDLIVDYIAPNVVKINPDIVFVIAGPGVPKFSERNIRFVGFVEDIHSFLNAADMAIVPILKGGGTRVKILDYMNVGLPVVTTKKGIEGIEVVNWEEAVIVEDFNEFIESLLYLAYDEKERRRIGKNARRLVKRKYDWKVIGKKLDQLYRRLVPEGN